MPCTKQGPVSASEFLIYKSRNLCKNTTLSYPKGQFIDLVNRDKGVHVVKEKYIVQNGNKQRQGPVDHCSGQMKETSQQPQPHVDGVSIQLHGSPPFQVRCLLTAPVTSSLGPIHCCSCEREKKRNNKQYRFNLLNELSWIKLIDKSLPAEIRISIALRCRSKGDWMGFMRLEAVCCTKAVPLSWGQAQGCSCLFVSTLSLPCPLYFSVLVIQQSADQFFPSLQRQGRRRNQPTWPQTKQPSENRASNWRFKVLV